MSKPPRLSLRQAEVLVAIYWRYYNYGVVKVRDLVGDIGVAFSTLFDHLKNLRNKGLIDIPSGKKTMNLGPNDTVILTDLGRKLASELLLKCGVSEKDVLAKVLDSIRRLYETKKKRHYMMYGLSNKAIASNIINKLFDNNPTEPVSTTLAMYSDLDPQLFLLRHSDKEEFVKLSRVLLNVGIRIGRIASIVIPVGLRSSIREDRLRDILDKSWSWPGIVPSSTRMRYFIEASSMGLIHKQGPYVRTVNPTIPSMLEWLSMKTLGVFKNTIRTVPKASIILYRELFKFPSIDDIYNPRKADRFDWLTLLRENMDYETYRTIMRDTLIVLKDKAGVVYEYENILIPATLYRTLEKASDIKDTFLNLVKYARDGNMTASILLTIHANPGISLSELKTKIRDAAGKRISERELKDAITHMVEAGLVYIAQPYGSTSEYLYTFTHIPFLTEKNKHAREANAIMRNIKPWILSGIKEKFNHQERMELAQLIEKLALKRKIGLTDIETEYGRKFFIKLLMWLETLHPFIIVDPDNDILSINRRSKIAGLILDVLHYSILTGNEALGMYAPTLSEMIEKAELSKRILKEAKLIKEELTTKLLKKKHI